VMAVANTTEVEKLVVMLLFEFGSTSEAADCFNELYRTVGGKNRYDLALSMKDVTAAWETVKECWEKQEASASQ
jgi:hypothetical protein